MCEPMDFVTIISTVARKRGNQHLSFSLITRHQNPSRTFYTMTLILASFNHQMLCEKDENVVVINIIDRFQ